MSFKQLPALVKRLCTHSKNIFNYAAQASYGVLLAFLPGMMIYYMVASIFFQSSSGELMRALTVIFPPGILDYSETQDNLLEQLQDFSRFYMLEKPLVSVISFLTLLFFVVYAIIRIVHSLMVISNRVAEFEESRGFVTLWKSAAMNALVLASFTFLAIYFYMATAQVRTVLLSFYMQGTSSALDAVFTGFRYVYLIAVLVFAFTWCYAVFPAQRLRIKQALPGGIFAVAFWLLLTNLIRNLQLVGIWPIGSSDLTRAVNLIFYAYLFSFNFILGMNLNIQLIQLNKDKSVSNQVISDACVLKYDTRPYIPPEAQLGRINRNLFLKKYYPNLSTKTRYTILINQIADSLTVTNFPGICTQLAFYLLCAIVPFLVYILEFTSKSIPDFKTDLFAFLSANLPKLSYEFITGEVNELLKYASETHSFMGIAALIFTCVTIHTLLSGINQTYGFTRYLEKRVLWLKSAFFTVLIVLAAEILMTIFQISNSVRAWLHSLLISGLPDEFSSGLYLFLFAEAVLFGILTVVYMYAPEKRYPFKRVLPGTIFSMIALTIVFRIYLFFLNRSQTYLLIYGSMSGLFTLLVVMFFLSCVLNIGAKINVFFTPDQT